MSYNDTCCRFKQEEIDALEARIVELEDALRPFADVSGEGDEDFPDETQVVAKFGRTTDYALTLGDLRKAARALAMSR